MVLRIKSQTFTNSSAALQILLPPPSAPLLFHRTFFQFLSFISFLPLGMLYMLFLLYSLPPLPCLALVLQ